MQGLALALPQRMSHSKGAIGLIFLLLWLSQDAEDSRHHKHEVVAEGFTPSFCPAVREGQNDTLCRLHANAGCCSHLLSAFKVWC